jgi:IS5 family transposase
MLYRLEKSRGIKNVSASPQRSLRDRTGSRRVQELEEQSDVPLDSTFPNRRQPQSMHDRLGRSEQTKNVSLTASTTQINISGSQYVHV